MWLSIDSEMRILRTWITLWLNGGLFCLRLKTSAGISRCWNIWTEYLFVVPRVPWEKLHVPHGDPQKMDGLMTGWMLIPFPAYIFYENRTKSQSKRLNQGISVTFTSRMQPTLIIKVWMRYFCNNAGEKNNKMVYSLERTNLFRWTNPRFHNKAIISMLEYLIKEL